MHVFMICVCLSWLSVVDQAGADIKVLEAEISKLEKTREIGAGEGQRRRQLITDLYTLNSNVKDILSGAKRRSAHLPSRIP